MIDNIKNEVLEFVNTNPNLSSKNIHDGLKTNIGYATVKRILTKLISSNLILTIGKGRGTKYVISPAYELFYPIYVEDYFEKELDDREIKDGFNFSLISDVMSNVALFNKEEANHLKSLQNKYIDNISTITEMEYKKELERLAIDLSWKSSQIEGNTYSLLETERLLKEKETAAGKGKDEATMLFNHKKALDFIFDDPTYVSPLTITKIEDIHNLLVKDLDIDKNIRKRRVGITGTNYKPLDNEYQIKEALRDMCKLINNRNSIFEKALFVLVLISYIQPFMDGNKRTARIVSNAVLISNGYCPISFRTIDSVEYKKAMLIFYEQNNITAFKKIFIDQFEFAVRTYF
ncbi:MAG: Fic family protein [Candidatus Marinimicrobia bacterium]|nr:Fic family protein [Candidatus Neomarinimicrobiota bacterium]